MRWVLLAVLIGVTSCSLALGDFPLPPPVPSMPSDFVSAEIDPMPVGGGRGGKVADQPSFAPGIFTRDGQYYRRMNGELQVYTNVCNGRSCSPGWYPAPAALPAQAPPVYRASGCSGAANFSVMSGCSDSSGSVRQRGRFRLRSRVRGCGG